MGCGDIARKRVADALIDAPDSQLFAACRRDAQKLRAFAAEYGIERTYTSGDDLLRDPEIDAVYIATPPRYHLPQTLAAAAAGKHVLVEKPMALSTAECRQMVDACRAANVRLGVAYYRRFYPIVRRMKEILTSGEIGRPMFIAAATSTSMQPDEEGAWRLVPAESGGGSLMDIGSHRLNLFLDLFGPVADVAAACDTLAGSYAAEDCATLLLRFESGAHGSLHCLFNTSADLDDFCIVGTKGRMQANPLNGGELVIDQGNTERVEDRPPPANLHSPLVVDFVQAIRERRDPVVTGEEGLRVNQVMERAYAATRLARLS
jgi:predicted dehydrogenase